MTESRLVDSDRVPGLSCPRGQALAEFSVVFPVWLLLTLTILQAALISVGRLHVKYAAFAAARAALVSDAGEGLDPVVAARLAALPVTGTDGVAREVPPLPLPEAVRRWLATHGGNLLTLRRRWAASAEKTRASVRREEGAVVAEVEHDFELVVPLAGRLIATGRRLLDGPSPEETMRPAETGRPHLTLRESATLPAPWPEEAAAEAD